VDDLDLDDGRELEHLPVDGAVALGRADCRPARPRRPTAEVVIVAVAMTALLLVGVDGEGRRRGCGPSPVSIRSWGVIDVDQRTPVLVAVVDVDEGAEARLVRLAADGGQDTAPVVHGHAVVAVGLSRARLAGATGARLSPAALADLAAVRVIARDADGWSVARAPVGGPC
jgi:hypothetical protein